MTSSQRKKFNPPLKKLVPVPATPNLFLDGEPSLSTVTPSSSLPSSQVHTLLSYCDDEVSVSSTPLRKFPSRTIKKKKMHQYNYSVAKNIKTVTKKKWKLVANHHSDNVNKCAATAFEYPLTPANYEQTASKELRTKEQIVVDKMVLDMIAKTRSEIQTIRLEHSAKQTASHSTTAQGSNGHPSSSLQAGTGHRNTSLRVRSNYTPLKTNANQLEADKYNTTYFEREL